MTTEPILLLADDDPRDVELFLLGLEQAGLSPRVQVVHDGEAVLDYLQRQGAWAGQPAPSPKVVFLDLNMPKLDGLEVLRHIKADPALRRIPVVAFTSSRQARDLTACYAWGVNAYVVKPLEFSDFMATVGELGRFWMGHNEVA